MRFQRLISVASLTLLAFSSFGCHKAPSSKPAAMMVPGLAILPAANITPDTIAHQLALTADLYRADLDKGDLASAKVQRNRFVFTLMGEIEAKYGVYEHEFRSHRAAAETATDMALLGVTAATAVVGEAGIKDMLAAAGVAGNGSKLSAEKNFLNEEGTTALLTQMRASRAAIEAQIISRCATDVSSYSLEEAWKDLNKYVNAGSIESAMIAIAANAGSDNVQQQQKVDTAIAKITIAATPQEVTDSKLVRKIASSLFNAIQPPAGTAADPAASLRAQASIAAILTAAGTPPTSNDPQKLIDQLQTQMAAAPGDPAALAKLTTAIEAAPKEFGGNGQ